MEVEEATLPAWDLCRHNQSLPTVICESVTVISFDLHHECEWAECFTAPPNLLSAICQSILLLKKNKHTHTHTHQKKKKNYPLMILRGNKSDLAHGSQFPIQLIWPKPQLTTELKWKSDMQKWQDQHQQIISWAKLNPGLGQPQIYSHERLQRISANMSVPWRDTWSWH